MGAILVGLILASPPASAPVAPPSAPVAPPSAPASAAPATEVPARTTIRGRAEDAKLAAAVVTDTGVVYLIDRPSWPADERGHEVEVTGVLEVTDAFQARVDAQGAISQGTTGGDTLMRQATIRVLP